jgi:hypothetical protein
MDTSTWGPKLWDCLFLCARDLEPADASAVLRLVRDLIPCALCRASYRHWHRTYPLGEGGNAVEWLWYIHDLVNGKLGKPRLPLSKLLARLATFECSVSPFDVVDTLLIMARYIDPESEEAADALFGLLPLFAKVTWPVSLRPRPMLRGPTGPTADAMFDHLVHWKQTMLRDAGRTARVLVREHEWALYGGTLATPVAITPFYPKRRPRGTTAPPVRTQRGVGEAGARRRFAAG